MLYTNCIKYAIIFKDLRKRGIKMEKSFPVILCELRKERGMSQKEAAAKLGVSQALLSHYEKGIRECGQSFLIKAADFYGVTCDYLLGRAPNRIGSEDFDYFFESEHTDAFPMRKTLYKAIGAVVAELAVDGKQRGIEFNDFLASQLYKLILIEAKAGNLPANWAGKIYVNGEVKLTPVFLNLVENASLSTVSMDENKKPIENKPAPDALKTIVQTVENKVLTSIIEKLPPIPLEMIK